MHETILLLLLYLSKYCLHENELLVYYKVILYVVYAANYYILIIICDISYIIFGNI